MDNTLVRIVFAFVIVLTATRDPSIAILIAIAFIITLQTANKYRLINTSLSVSQPGESSWLPSAKGEMPEDESPEPELEQQEQQDMNEMHMMEQAMPSNNLNEPIIEPMASEPATEQPTNSFTSEYQFLDASSNNVPGANQDSSVSTFENQMSVQGLHNNTPDGLSGPEYHSL